MVDHEEKVNELYDFFQTYFLLPSQLTGLSKIPLEIKTPNFSGTNWFYKISYGKYIEIYFCLNYINIFIEELDKEMVNILELEIKKIKNANYSLDINRSYFANYNINLLEVPYRYFPEVKNLLLKLA